MVYFRDAKPAEEKYDAYLTHLHGRVNSEKLLKFSYDK